MAAASQGPRSDVTRDRHHREASSRTQCADCIDHQYAPSGTISRTNTIAVGVKAARGEAPVNGDPMVASSDNQTASRIVASGICHGRD